jgi:two-component system sensor histidine kinase VicK
MIDDPQISYHHYLQGEGEMASLTRSFDWATTPIGSPGTWPQSLLTTISIILNSRFPMFLWWGPDLIQFYNDAYRPSLGNDGKHPKALGQRGEDCWQEIWPVIKPLIDQVLATGEPTWSEDQLIPIYRNNLLEDVYWTFGYSSVVDEFGKRAGVLVICTETTEKVKAYNAEKEANELLKKAQAETKSQRDRLKRFFTQAPAGICVLDGPNLVFELINPSYQQLFPGRNLLGKPALEALPEIKQQPIWDILQNVYHTGKTFAGNELLVPLARYADGPVEDRYFNFTYQARHDANGVVDGILVFVYEVTEIVQAKRRLEESEKRFRNMIEQSPVALLVNKGDELIFEEINQPMIDIIGRGDSVKGKSWYEAIPELVGQPIVDQLYRTYRTGQEWRGFEVPIILNQNGKPEQHYYNLVYKPFLENGEIIGLLQSAVEVTEQVNARRELEKTQDTLKLALQAAELGTFDMDLEKGTMEWDKRCRTLFGISHNNKVTYEKDFVTGLHPDDRERVLGVIANVFKKHISNGDYDVEYRTIGVEDQRIRWVRAKGKAYFDENDRPVRFIGAALDITEQKNDELRKNDFIGMVSHELKTPLTSLTAIVQILQGKVSKNEDGFMINALDKANNQVKKMTVMINSFLNISRLESGKIHLVKQDFNLDELIIEVIAEAELTMPTHLVTLIPSGTITVNADRDKIGSVISNLLSNAVKYSPRGKQIEVQCERIDHHVIVYVKDQGMGIREEDIEKIFERYYRVQSSHREQIAGFGIGLYLSAEIIERHGGRIGVNSEVGKGSSFWFALPLNE